MPRIVKLIQVTAANNNKFYDMTEKTDGSWTAHWGRVGATGETMDYSAALWDKKYREKIKKGYRDITEMRSVAKQEADEPEVKIANASTAVSDLVNYLQGAARDTIKQNYTVQVADVTEAQIKAAQDLIDKLVTIEQARSLDKEKTNAVLLELYQVIPRKMNHIKHFILQDDSKKDFFRELLSNEQSLLDVMQGQVSTVSKKTSKSMDLAALNLLLGEASAQDINLIKTTTDLIIGKSTKIYTVSHGLHEKAYQAIPEKHAKLLYHGSRNENWWSILNAGLKIRPSNAIHTGSMFGDGIYFANKAAKSLGYSSLSGSYWSKGNANKAFLALYSVNLGNSWDVFKGGQRHNGSMSSLNLKKCRDNGFDSVFARGGADLRNDEFIIYENGRCKIKYLVEINK
jgi:poly [ADP-ribose] polymerase